ncbi:MAG: thioredoxin [Clostridia bacterium]|nr:thioredoxin [Clostridia bacterium]
MSEIIINKDNFEKEVLKSEIPVLVDFWATWCGPCRMISPIVSKLAEEYKGKVKVCKINVDDESELADNYGIVSIPTLILFKNGAVSSQTMGYMDEEKLKNFIEENK